MLVVSDFSQPRKPGVLLALIAFLAPLLTSGRGVAVLLGHLFLPGRDLDSPLGLVLADLIVVVHGSTVLRDIG